MSNHQEILSSLLNIKGVLGPFEYDKALLPFIFLRRLDCVLEPNKDEVYELYQQYKEKDFSAIIQQKTNTPYYNHSKFDLTRLKEDPKNLISKFQDYIEGYSTEIRDIIENFNLLPIVKRIHEENQLQILLDNITEIDLSPKVLNDSEMGDIYMELIRNILESNIEIKGEHYTPINISNLLISLILEDSDHINNKNPHINLYDPCSGSGGLLKIGRDRLQQKSKKFEISVSGQEINNYAYSIGKSLFIISGDRYYEFRNGSSLTNDKFSDQKFQYMVANPPYGMSWKSEKEFIESEFSNREGRFSIGLPRSSDSSLLFVQHLLSKMDEEGAKIGIILNESPLFTGDAGSGESEIRRYIIENDLLECVVALPEKIFYNTSIPTYIWILNNNKTEKRKGSIQLIDGSDFFTILRNKKGNKSRYITEKDATEICEIYKSCNENQYSQLFENEFFGYKKVKVLYPELNKDGEPITLDEGELTPEHTKVEYERIPLNKEIDKYIKNEVKPFREHAKVDSEYERIGYGIDFKEVFLQREVKQLKKDFPSSEWIKLKYLGSFVDDVSDNSLVIRSHFSDNENSITPIVKKENFTPPNKFNKRWFQIFNIEDPRIKPKTLSGYFKSKFGEKDLSSCFKGFSHKRLNKDYFLNLKVPIIDSETQKFYSLNLELIDKIETEIKTIEKEVVYQFNSENSENLYKRLFNILESTDQLIKEDEIKNLIQKGESYQVEFKETFHTNVRNNYQKDENIRHSSLKTICGFLNSKGGHLLVGVHDKQFVTGIEKDLFKNNDSYLLTIKNLIKDRIGTNALSYVNYDIYKIDGKRVLLFECQRSSDPVYLDTDHFYVRVNPSTEELKGGDLVKYVNENFKQ